MAMTATNEEIESSRTIKFIGAENFRSNYYQTDFEASDKASLTKFLMYLNRTNLVVSAVLFLCQAGSAICLCRPVVVLGGTLVSILFLFQGILGRYIIRIFSKTMLLGYACMSAFVSLSGLASASYLLSGQFTVACVSSFHTFNDDSATRLRIVEGISLVASVPCLLGFIACFLSAVLSASASKRFRKVKQPPQVILYLQPSQGGESSNGTEKSRELNSEKANSPSAPKPQPQDFDPKARCDTPPPSYQIANEESYA